MVIEILLDLKKVRVRIILEGVLCMENYSN